MVGLADCVALEGIEVLALPAEDDVPDGGRVACFLVGDAGRL